MSSEDPFRIALLVLFTLAVTLVGHHRLKARSGEPISRKDEGLLLGVSLRMAGLFMWLGVLVYMINPAWMEWSQLALPGWLRWLGAAVGVLFLGTMYWTLANLGQNLTDTVMTRANATLVTGGPYRFVRHPFYLNVLLLMLAATLLSGNWFVGVCALLVFVLLVVRTKKEEQQLIDKFGDAYREYMARTGRFVPKM